MRRASGLAALALTGLTACQSVIGFEAKEETAPSDSAGAGGGSAGGVGMGGNVSGSAGVGGKASAGAAGAGAGGKAAGGASGAGTGGVGGGGSGGKAAGGAGAAGKSGGGAGGSGTAGAAGSGGTAGAGGMVSGGAAGMVSGGAAGDGGAGASGASGSAGDAGAGGGSTAGAGGASAGTSGAAGSGVGGSGGSAPCAAGTAFCTGSTLKVCNGDGTTTDTACSGATPVCDAVNKECDTCLVGTAKCDGAVLKVCSADGKTTTDTTCDSEGQCSVNQMKCLGAGSVVEIAVGYHACARMLDGTVRCWGDNDSGELGRPTPSASWTALSVPGLGGVLAVGVGSSTSCAVVGSARTVRCWGSSEFGYLGPKQSRSSDPVDIQGLDDVQELAVGASSVCGRRGDGTVWCAGRNGYGQLGDGTTNRRSSAAAVPGLSNVVELSPHSNADALCARSNDGEIKCWGNGGNGTNGVLSPITAVATGSDANSMAVSDSFLFVQYDSGITQRHSLSGGSWKPSSVVATSPFSQMDASSSSLCGVETNGGHPPDFAPGTVAQCEINGSLTCFRTIEGHVLCKGSNTYGQLGNGKALFQSVPTIVPGVVASDLVAGYRSTYARLTDGSWATWGQHPGLQIESRLPVAASPALTQSAGGTLTSSSTTTSTTHAYVIDSSGVLRELLSVKSGATADSSRLNSDQPRLFRTAYMWLSGQIDLGLTTSGELVAYTAVAISTQSAPYVFGTAPAAAGSLRSIPDAQGAVGLARPAGGDHACVWFGDGRVRCWGSSSSRQTGTVAGAAGAPVLQPTDVYFSAPQPRITRVELGTFYTCALDGDGGGVYCWGAFNRVGHGLSAPSGPAYHFPILVPGTAGAVGVTVGWDHTCAWFADGTAKCWGDNSKGQLGDGTLDYRSGAVPILQTNIAKVVAGGIHTCALLKDGTVSCWGDNVTGQVGNGYPLSETTYQTVVGLD